MRRKLKIPSVNVAGRFYPQTHSGRAVLRSITDQEAQALSEGDVLIIVTIRGTAPWFVDYIKTGTAGNLGQQYEVPVIVGHNIDGLVLVRAVPDCYLFDVL